MQPNSQADFFDPTTVSNASKSAPSQSARNGRPRALDELKRREICALVAAGCGLREAARYVRCGVDTIRREAKRNHEFGEQLRRSEMCAQLSPLRAMQQAVGTHWRAAAWMLERAFPNRFSRPESGAFGPRQARQLMNEVLTVVNNEISDPFKYARMEKRLRGTFEYFIRAAGDRRRTSQNLRQAMNYFDEKEKPANPLADFGIQLPEFESLVNSSPAGANPRRPAPAAHESDFVEAVRKRVAELDRSTDAKVPTDTQSEAITSDYCVAAPSPIAENSPESTINPTRNT